MSRPPAPDTRTRLLRRLDARLANAGATHAERYHALVSALGMSLRKLRRLVA